MEALARRRLISWRVRVTARLALHRLALTVGQRACASLARRAMGRWHGRAQDRQLHTAKVEVNEKASHHTYGVLSRATSQHIAQSRHNPIPGSPSYPPPILFLYIYVLCLWSRRRWGGPIPGGRCGTGCTRGRRPELPDTCNARSWRSGRPSPGEAIDPRTFRASNFGVVVICPNNMGRPA